VDLGGGLGIRHNRDEHPPGVADWVGPLAGRLEANGLGGARLVLEPGRSLVGRAGVTLYRVGVVKESGGVTYVAIDGGMSDNPRPQLYGARYEALLANRADELPTGVYRVAGKHCESGDVLIEAAELPHPEPGDLLAVPATGAYTLALGSTYNGVPRPAVVLVTDGVPDTPAAKNDSLGKYKRIDVSKLEYLSKNVTVRVLYPRPTIAVRWEKQVPRHRVRMWTVDDEVMDTWKKHYHSGESADQQTELWKWIADNVDFRVRSL